MACEGLKEKFKQYAGDDDLLELEEFKKMIEGEVANDRIRKRLLKRASKIIEKKGTDGKLSFEEFEKCSCLMKKLKEKEQKGEPIEDSD